MGNHPSNHQPLDKGGVSKFGDVHARRSLRSPRKMDRLRRSFRDSFRKRKERVPESSKPHQWQSDEAAVRAATCTFAVKYLGCVEVFESRGMQVCEEAIKVLRGSRRRPVRATLHISGDGLRVVEDETKGLIVDQTIEKVSFCAPDRNHERGFSYICRDGTTRRWMCHGFLALRESGERLSHAVGCAFAVCLERKQRRDKECGVTMMFDARNNTFTRTGSFRTQGLTERLEHDIDVPPNNNIQSPPGVGLSGGTVNPFAIERPHATPSMLERQGSFRGLGTLGQSSPFKRQMSLRVSDLPSNTERLSQFHHLHNNGTTRGANGIKSVSPIPEMPNNSMNGGGGGDSVTALCQQLSQGLSQLTHSGSDDFNFNSRSSVNQNNINESNIGDTSATSPTLMQLHSPTSPSLATPNITSLPTTSSVLTSPGTMNFSQNSTNSVITPIKAGSPPANRLGGMIVAPSSSALPRPEQWLGQIVSSASPPQRGAGGGARILAAPPSGIARRGLALSAHSRAMSLDSHEIGHTRPGDPFDADWANMAARQNSNNTNPFLSTANAAPQPFQVQL